MKIKSYCELLFGSREAYQKKVVAQLKKSRLKKRIDLVPVDKILEKEGLPLVREVERDPSKLTSRFFSLVSGSFGCTVNGDIGREIKKFLKSSQIFERIQSVSNAFLCASAIFFTISKYFPMLG